MKPELVVLGWGGLLAVLMFVMFAYRENGLFIAMYGLGVLLTLGSAGIVWLATRQRKNGSRLRIPVKSRSAGFVALVVLFTGLAFVYGFWFGVAAFLALVFALLAARGERMPAGVRPAPTSVPTLPAERTRAPVALVRPVKAVATVASVVAALRSLVRRGRRMK